MIHNHDYPHLTPLSVDRTEVIPDNSNPEFDSSMRLKPRDPEDHEEDGCSTPSAEEPVSPGSAVAADAQMFYYEKHHVLVFSVYDSCRKDALVSSSVLDSDMDLALLGSAHVRIDDLVQRIAEHEVDPRKGLCVTVALVRDRNQSLVSKTFEQLGKGVSMINNLSFFADELSNTEPALILNLAPIRCVCCCCCCCCCCCFCCCCCRRRRRY